MKKLIMAMTALLALLNNHPHLQLGAANPPVSIEQQLIGKTKNEKADIKSSEIIKNNFTGTYTDTVYGETIEIKSISKIDRGIEIYARAWKGTEQLGFGADGTTEWERFIILNPPILVNDPNGKIIRQWSAAGTGELKTKK
jgi:hypothetical protein